MGRTSKSIRKSTQKAVNGEARRTAPQVGLLPKEAYTVLRTYYAQVTRHPSKVQYDDLLTKIRCIPGCENCKPRKLRDYFKEKRKTEARVQLAAENKVRSRAKPVKIIKTINPLPPSQLCTLPAESEPPPLRPPLRSSHLYPAFRSDSDHVPTTFIDLTQWLQEQNTRFMDLASAEGLR